MKPKILVVDDRKDTARGYASLIGRGLGGETEIRTAFAGDTAVTLACEFKPDLVLLDVQLPVLDGFGVLEQLKARKVATRVIMVTGVHKDIPSIVRAIRAGACDFLSKPVGSEIMVQSIRRALLLEAAVNLNMADAPQLVKQLLDRVEDQNKEARQVEIVAQAASKSERRENRLWELVYLGASACVVWGFHHLGLVSTAPTAFTFVLFFYLLTLIPAERIRSLTASALGLKAHMEVEPPSGTPKKLLRAKDRSLPG